MVFTSDDIVAIFNAVGFESAEVATNALAVANAFVTVGFTDPTLFTPVIRRLKLIDEKLKLQTQAQILLTEQQAQVQQLVEASNPAIGVINNQVTAIDLELAQLQV